MQSVDRGRDPPGPDRYATLQRTDFGCPAAAIRFRTATPTAASVCWPAKPRACSRGPICDRNGPLSFRPAQLAVVGVRLPSQAPPVSDQLQMAITLCGRTRFAAGHSRRAWRDHHLDIVAVRGDRLRSGVSIIRTISHHPDDRARQYDRAAAPPETDHQCPDPQGFEPRSCRWRHRPPDATCATNNAALRRSGRSVRVRKGWDEWRETDGCPPRRSHRRRPLQSGRA